VIQNRKGKKLTVIIDSEMKQGRCKMIVKWNRGGVKNRGSWWRWENEEKRGTLFDLKEEKERW